MVVMKFGGSSVATAAAIARVRAIVGAERRPRVVVVSALAGVTDMLLALAARAEARDDEAALRALQGIRDRHASLAAAVRDRGARHDLLARLDTHWTDAETVVRAVSLLKACPPAASDAIVAQGELASSLLVAAILKDAGLPAEWIDARRVVVTDGAHQHAAPLPGNTADRLARLVQPLVASGAIPVLGGFIGATTDGVTSTLGRGGSDYSASLVGACLEAAEIQIWTDVDGMLTADPRLYSRTRLVGRLSFAEASALARFGAKVLHPSTVRPAVLAGIPVRILNSHRPAGRGTLVADGPVRRTAAVAGIASLPHICVFDVTLPDGTARPAALAAVFEACAQAQAAVHLMAVSERGVSVAVDDGPASDRVAARLGPDQQVTRRGGLALVAAVGDALAASQGIAWRALAACAAIPVRLLSCSPGSNHVAWAVDQADLAFAVATLHEFLFERQATFETGDGRTGASASPLAACQETPQEVRA